MKTIGWLLLAMVVLSGCDPAKQHAWYLANKKTQVIGDIERVCIFEQHVHHQTYSRVYSFLINGKLHDYVLEASGCGGCQFYYDLKKDEKIRAEVDYVPPEAYGWQKGAYRRIDIAIRIYLHSPQEIEIK
jgi:hypothetical protein